ncbi:MAG: hypothetical protein DRI36_04075 [Caldiserica bacterium]|nr:MAG: hypothetical protein DRI36_04075 [Caldisericota bacterium]
MDIYFGCYLDSAFFCFWLDDGEGGVIYGGCWYFVYCFISCSVHIDTLYEQEKEASQENINYSSFSINLLNS